MSDVRTSAPGPRTRALLARADELEGAIGIGGSRVPSDVVDSVRAVLAGVRERLDLGVDQTVVALAGGTGSGKSSVFNAISGLDFADVGVRRPTTAKVTACVWAHDASRLLDWLGVAEERRIERESALDGEDQADLRGLVLLDLPDHDSIQPEHRAVVDRILPQVDLLVWVVDPQKYADDALHNTYLCSLAGHEGAMLVLLNQIDTVPLDSQVSLLRDVDRLLRGDGLVGVGVHAASARTGEGIPSIRGVLARAVAALGVAEVRVQAELDDAGRTLAGAVATAEPDVTAAASASVEGLSRAAGIPAAAAAVATAVSGGSVARVRLGPVQPDRAAAVRQVWMDEVGASLPRPWADAVEDAVPPAETLVRAVDERLAAISVPTGQPRSATVVRWTAAGAGVLALVAAGLTAGSLLGEDRWDTGTTVLALVTAGIALVALGLLRVARWVRGRVASRRSSAVLSLSRLALAAAVDEALVRPTTVVLEDHRTVREAAGPLLATSLRRTNLLGATIPPTAEVRDGSATDRVAEAADDPLPRPATDLPDEPPTDLPPVSSTDLPEETPTDLPAVPVEDRAVDPSDDAAKDASSTDEPAHEVSPT
jgi:energy-coupling factor transporter ATP-binding protein EcfA2